MIRVLHVFGIMNIGGAETMIMNVYRHIDREKIQFDFLCMSESIGDYEKEIKELGGRIYKILPPNKVGYIKHINDIIGVCKKYGPYRAIHIPTMFHSGIVCLAAYLVKIPIRIVHSHSASKDEKSLIRLFYQFICRKLINVLSNKKIACGEAARDFLFGKSKKQRKQVIVLKNGIDIEKFSNININETLQLEKQLGINKNDLIIGHVGRFSKVKNHEFFIKLAKEWKDMNYKILLVGDGELMEEIKDAIRKNNLEDKFILTGKRNDINVIMSLMDVLVMPSLFEGFPLVLVEALASGMNCVVSNNISKEVDIDKGSIEFIGLEENVQKWINAIIEKANQKVDINHRKRCLEDNGFSIHKTTEILTKIYLGE